MPLLLLRIVYNPAVWSEFGYTIQRYIGNAMYVIVPIFAGLVGVWLVPKLFRWWFG